MRPEEGDERDRWLLLVLVVFALLAFFALASATKKPPVERGEPPPLPPRGLGQRLAAQRGQLAGAEEQDVGRGGPKGSGGGDRRPGRSRQEARVELSRGPRVRELAQEAEGEQEGPGVRQKGAVAAGIFQEVPEGEEASAREQAWKYEIENKLKKVLSSERERTGGGSCVFVVVFSSSSSSFPPSRNYSSYVSSTGFSARS